MEFFIIGFFITVLILLPVGLKGVCETIPGIDDSSHNATGRPGPFADGSAIQFTCNPRYTGVGSPYFYCRGSGWAGNYTCVLSCQRIKAHQHGLIIGNPPYLVNTTLKFTCLDGYTINGSSSMMCSADGNWKPEDPPICEPVRCEAFVNIPNGEVFEINPDGVLNDFGSKFKISCNDGYNPIGSPIVTCKSDGKWSSRIKCEASLCGTHPGSKSQCIHDSSAGGPLLSLQCRENSTNVSVTVGGTNPARCKNKQWNNLDMGCFCDCLVNTDSREGVTYHDLNKKFVKHGDNLIWECGDGYKKQTLANISCNDGQMATPYCIRVEKEREIPVWVWLIVIVISIYSIVCTLVIMWMWKRLLTNQKPTDKSNTEPLLKPSLFADVL